MKTDTKCSHCGAMHSLEVDYLRGEVVCSECGYVAAHGLEEDVNTRYDEDIVRDQGHHFHMGMTVDGKTEKLKGRDAAMKRASNALDVIRTRTALPEMVKESAMNLVAGFYDRCKTRNVPMPDLLLLAATCFVVAGRLRSYPIQSHELASISALRGTTESKIASLQPRLIADMSLQEAWSETSADFARNLVMLYGRRLQPVLTPRQCVAAAAIYAAFTEHVSGKEPSLVAQFAIYIVVHEQSDFERLRQAAGLPEVPEHLRQEAARTAGVKKIATVAKSDEGKLRGLLAAQPVSTAVLVETALKKLTEVDELARKAGAEGSAADAASTTTAAAGDDMGMAPERKRDRD